MIEQLVVLDLQEFDVVAREPKLTLELKDGPVGAIDVIAPGGAAKGLARVEERLLGLAPRLLDVTDVVFTG